MWKCLEPLRVDFIFSRSDNQQLINVTINYNVNFKGDN